MVATINRERNKLGALGSITLPFRISQFWPAKHAALTFEGLRVSRKAQTFAQSQQ
jgi:hypothetical protein